MSHQPCCGCPVTIINPPDFGHALRMALRPTYPASIPWPLDPGISFPRVVTGSYAAWQDTALGCAPESHGWQPRFPISRGMPLQRFAQYRNQGLNFAADEILRLFSQALYPVPGIWIGPVRIHLPSGNVLLQLPAPLCGPLDAIPVFTYNSLASAYDAGRGRGVSDLFNPSVEEQSGITNLITGTGSFLEYLGVGVNVWGSSPASTRNGLKKRSGGGWIERQPDSLEWHYNSDGFAEKIVAPNGDTWTITRNTDSLVASIDGPLGRTTSISGSGGTYVVTQPGSKVTTYTVSGCNLTSVQYPGGGTFGLEYTASHLLNKITDPGGHATTLDYDSKKRIKTLTIAGNAYSFNYIDDAYAAYNYIEVTDPASNITTIAHDCNVVQMVTNPLQHTTTYIWEGGVVSPGRDFMRQFDG